MSSAAPDLPIDRPRLEARLGTDLLTQSYLHDWHTADLRQLRQLEERIQSTARQLEPGAPQVAIAAARRELAYDDLANQLARRAELPDDPLLTPEPLRIRMQHQERGILDLARQLEPTHPAKAIARATPIARKHIVSQRELVDPEPAPQLEVAGRQLGGASRRLGRIAASPEPTRLQRVAKILGDLRRLELLDAQNQHVSQMRRNLVFRGNIIEIKATVERIPVPRDLLEESVADIYRDPGLAIKNMRENTHREGLDATIQRFDIDPATFGKLRGIHVPGLGDSPERAKALDLVWHRAGEAATALARRGRIVPELDAAVYYQGIQNENRELAGAFPSRDTLLSELGRHMEGLELHEVRPLLRQGQAKLVQDVRRAEQHFLEPLREGAGKLLSLEASGVPLAQSAVQAKAQGVAALFRYAPRHILKRLTPPQMQGALLAAAVAKQVKRLVARVATP